MCSNFDPFTSTLLQQACGAFKKKLPTLQIHKRPKLNSVHALLIITVPTRPSETNPK